MTHHSSLLNKVLLKLSELDYCRAWRNETGVARSMDGRRVISYGKKGSSDIIGICRGKFLAIEIKINKDKLRPEQINFRAMIERLGGMYYIIKTEEDLCLCLDHIKKMGSINCEISLKMEKSV